MRPWLEDCERWLARQYSDVLGQELGGDIVRLRWLPEDSLLEEVDKDVAGSFVIEDSDIGWLLFFSPYVADRIDRQISQALGARARLLREANYTGIQNSKETEDPDGPWHVGLIWLVSDEEWSDWENRILEQRRGSGAAEEISFDALRVTSDNVQAALDMHGLPRLLLNARALLMQSAAQAESWLSADVHVAAQLENFSQRFNNPRARAFARQFEDLAKTSRSSEVSGSDAEARRYSRFRVRHFRNLENLEVAGDEANAAQAIVLFGPNASGKSSFAEALSLAAFGTSPRMTEFLVDKDVRGADVETYLTNYLVPLDSKVMPSFSWGSGVESRFTLSPDSAVARRFEGVVLNQEDSLDFTELRRQELAERVLTGYSALAERLSTWLAQEERRATDAKLAFTRKHGLSGTIKLRDTAYDRLAQGLLHEHLHRPSPEYLDWLNFLVRLGGVDGDQVGRLVAAWRAQQTNSVVQLAGTLAKMQAIGASEPQICLAIREVLDAYDTLARRSGEFRQLITKRVAPLQEQLDQALSWIDLWGAWLSARPTMQIATDPNFQALRTEAENITKEQGDVERKGKVLRGRSELLQQASQFLVSHWAAEHPELCPVCNTDVTDKKGIHAVVAELQAETNTALELLRARHVVLQNRLKDLNTKLTAAGSAACPVAADDQQRLRDWVAQFLSDGISLEEWLVDANRREQLKADLARMKIIPEGPTRYSDSTAHAQRLARDFIALSQDADRALDDPIAIGEVKKDFEKRMEKVLLEHLPTTLGKVWREITLALTAAPWLLPRRPALKLEQQGKALSVELEERDLLVRYLYNAAERHVLGLAWFFTYFLAKRRFEEAWMLLDDPAQEMDQPSYRDLVRFWETLLRLHRKKSRPFTLIVALNQEERALDAARATNGRLYVLGWQKTQDDVNSHSTVKRIVLLAPGFHPLKPEEVFE